jgi:AcrR family transcriptional regulator
MTENLPRRGRPVDHNARADRAAQILAAARRCFARSGFHAASTAEISAEAGVSVANLYQYFPSKEALVIAMTEADLRADLALIAQAFSGPGFLDRLALLIETIIEVARRDQEFRLRVEIFAEAFHNEPVREALARAEAQLQGALARAIEAAQRAGEVAPHLDPHGTAAWLQMLADGFYGRAGLGLVDTQASSAALREALKHGLSA